MKWNTKRALEVYRKVFPGDQVWPESNDDRIPDIVAEMNAVKFAPTAEDGAKEIEWWGWTENLTALQAAKRIRRFGPHNESGREGGCGEPGRLKIKR